MNHRTALSNELRGERSTQSGISPPEPSTKTCSRCGMNKRLSEFHPHRGTRDGLQSRCKSCHNDARRTGGSVGRPRKTDAPPTSVVHFDSLPDLALVGADVVSRLTGLDPTTITRRVREGTFPAPRMDGGRRVWAAGAIRAHLRAGDEAERRVGVYALGGIIRHAREVLGAARMDRIVADARAEAVGGASNTARQMDIARMR